MRSWLTTALCGVFLLLMSAPYAQAESYGDGFVNYWKKSIGKQDGVVMFVLGFGVLCILVLLSSGKWGKK